MTSSLIVKLVIIRTVRTYGCINICYDNVIFYKYTVSYSKLGGEKKDIHIFFFWYIVYDIIIFLAMYLPIYTYVCWCESTVQVDCLVRRNYFVSRTITFWILCVLGQLKSLQNCKDLNERKGMNRLQRLKWKKGNE